MIDAKLTAKLVWKIDPNKTFDNLTTGLRNKALRIALQAGAAPAKDILTGTSPSVLGLLRRALRIRVKNYQRGDIWTAVIGATSAFKRFRKIIDAVTGRGKIARNADGDKIVIQPARYQYPLDRGGKKNTPRDFVSRAFARSRIQFEQIAAFKLREQIELLCRQ